MEGPGGYQFVGRTVQMWNRFRQTASFRDEHPWLLRFFDQIKFYEVSEEQLLNHRRDFPLGRFEVKIEEGSFSLAEYQKFLSTEEPSITAFKNSQQAAFDAERERWRANGQAEYVSEDTASASTVVSELPAGCRYVSAVVPGSVWKITTPSGSNVNENETLAILESMKMEIPVETKFAGEVVEWLVLEGSSVAAGQPIAILREKKHA
jgi:urea carboxylase